MKLNEKLKAQTSVWFEFNCSGLFGFRALLRCFYYVEQKQRGPILQFIAQFQPYQITVGLSRKI
jgi:hypothetical protein